MSETTRNQKYLVKSMGKIAAGIVLFNPEDLKRFNTSLESVLRQVDKVYIFDNSTIANSYSFSGPVAYYTEEENKGIAYGMNRLMEAAQRDGFEWLITMDQDSVLPDNAISLYMTHINDVPNLAIICPQVIDSRRSYMEIKKEPEIDYIDYCITSGSCTNIRAWEMVGKYDEWLFIDLVDNDFCKRLIVSGFKILRLNKLVLDQEFGRIIPKSKKTQRFWNRTAKILKNKNFAKFGYNKIVSPMRVFYTCRNIVYVNKKLKKYGKTGYIENYNCNSFFGFLICFVAPSILRAQNRSKVTKAAIVGLRDGVKSKPVVWSVKE